MNLLHGFVVGCENKVGTVALIDDGDDRQDKECKAWPGSKTIAADLSLSRSTVKRTIKDLEKAALMRKEPHYRENGSVTSNRYYLLWKLYFYAKGEVCLSGPPQSRQDFVGRG